MAFSYIFLFLLVVSCFTSGSRITLLLFCGIAVFIAWFEDLIEVKGVIAVVIFYSLNHLYFRKNSDNKYLKAILLLLILGMTAGFVLHMIPGFNKMLVFDRVTKSVISAPFTMYINVDKIIAALILFLHSDLFDKNQSLDKRSFLIVLQLLILCSSILMLAGLLTGYIKFDFKIPQILFVWSLNNLLFVSFSEEVIFRGVIQRKLASRFQNQYISLILASMIFGLMHFKGGIIYILLSTIAGLFYGLSYQRTGKISAAIMVHFGFNLIHLIFFTYPKAI